MPSASRPFTEALVTDLVRRGVGIAPLVLHTGVSSLEGGERPYPERYRIDLATADAINTTHRRGGRVIAGGTTVVRALATVTDMQGVAHPGHGWTDTVVLPDSPLPGIDGLLTGWHEPEASHLWMLEAVAGLDPVATCVRGRARPRLPLARVRRQPPSPPRAARGTHVHTSRGSPGRAVRGPASR